MMTDAERLVSAGEILLIKVALYFLYSLIAVAIIDYVMTAKERRSESRRLTGAMERIAKALERLPGPH